MTIICCFSRSILCWSNFLGGAFAHTQNAPVELWSRYLTISSGSTKHHNVFGNNIKTWKRWPNFPKIQSMSILAIRNNRRQETFSMLNYTLKWQNWTIIFGIQWMRRRVLAFKKGWHIAWQSPFRVHIAGYITHLLSLNKIEFQAR